MIYQLVPAISRGDAVSNDIFALSDALTASGRKNQVVSETIPEHLKARVEPFSALKCGIEKEDLLIYHMAVGCDMNKWICRQLCRRIMIYHNITPEEYFDSYDENAAEVTRQGRIELGMMAECFDMSICDSEYNAAELRSLGYRNVQVLPLLIPFPDYRSEPDLETMNKYDDDYTNLLFVGRMAPNKRIEDIISAFYVYKSSHPQSRLFLVGSQAMERYSDKLENYVTNLGLEDVVFAGHTTFMQIIAYYQLADLFVCMSEHEGFCVPLVEAMLFDVPVLAYASSAVPETLGTAGVVFSEKNFGLLSILIEKLTKDTSIREKIIAGQKKRLLDFSPEKIEKEFLRLISDPK